MPVMELLKRIIMGRKSKYDDPMKKYDIRFPADVADFCRTIGSDAVVKILRYIVNHKSVQKEAMRWRND